jgi:PAS domain S-box-containing protein
MKIANLYVDPIDPHNVKKSFWSSPSHLYKTLHLYKTPRVYFFRPPQFKRMHVNQVPQNTNIKHVESLALLSNPATLLNEYGQILWVNNAFERLSGYKIDEIKNCFWQSLRKKSEFNFYRSVIEEQQAITCEYDNYTKGKVPYCTIASIAPLLDDNHRLEGVVIIETDITKVKEREKERADKLVVVNRITENSLMVATEEIDKLTKAKTNVENALKMKERFFAHMSHEIRTPMNGILGLTEFLMQKNTDIEQKECLSAMKASGDALLTVINEVLDFSKIEAGKMVFQEEPFYLSTVIDSVVNILSPKAKEKGIIIKKELSKDIPKILKGDSCRLNQILMNLVGNAVKFTSHGEIGISIKVNNYSAEKVTLDFCISDTGCGIPEYKISSLFSEFYQAHTSPNKYQGTGLGLAITKRMVELQGGVIQVQSRENEGSKFSFTLGFKRITQKDKSRFLENTGKDEEYIEAIQLAGTKILLVEDNPVNQLLGEKLLNNVGAEVDIAKSGDIAIEKLKEKLYDVVLMDIKMPGMSGHEVTHYIRTEMSFPACNVPIIALTAFAGASEVFKCLKTGMNDYVSKPFNANQLYQKILNVVNNKYNDVA